MPLSLVTLAPPFLIVTYIAILLVRRELTIASGFFGQLACEAFNLVLKRTFKQGRPTDFLGTGYGMPSSHSQFAGYFMAFWCLHLLRFRPGMSRARRAREKGQQDAQLSLINLLRTAEHVTFVVLIVIGCIVTAYSRYHLSYHTPSQIIVGFSLGLACGAAWYFVAEVVIRTSRFGMQHSFRRIVLENPVIIALRIRDSWAVWDDGGVEAEYGLWKGQWDRLQAEEDNRSYRPIATPGAQVTVDVERMLMALRLASKCEATKTAFSVGCVITESGTGQVLATGYSREEPGNTHAEEVALGKLSSSASKSGGRVQIQALTLYTTMEPCSERLSKKDACVRRILDFNAAGLAKQNGLRMEIKRIVQGVREPDDFVQCAGSRMLQDCGLQVVSLQAGTQLRRGKDRLTLQPGWLEREAVRLAKHGHDDQPGVQGQEDRAWKEDGWQPVSADAYLSDGDSNGALQKRKDR